ncbi:MAG TPA: iron ABC transporter permease, partial [Acidimicrobiales bacterium]|nr:iron ABC transporter permease [Acidimicrobiales bacterium]
RDRLRHHLSHHHLPGHHRTGPPLLFATAVVVGLAVVTPLVFLIVQAFQTGWSTLHPLLFRSLTAQLLWNTVSLTFVVTALCAVLGTVLAWFVERTDLPGRHLWAILVVVPLGIPDFVVSFGWRAIFPAFGGFWGAVLVMTLAIYPLVFLPVAANMRNADPAQEEVARGLGLGRLSTFWKVTVGQARLSILGGAVLVALVCLAEFGAFEILGFRTLTTEAYTEFTVGFNTAAGCAFSVILVVLGAILLLGEGAARGKGRAARMGSGASRVLRPRPLGRGTFPVLAGVAAVVVLALGVPVGAIIWLMVEGGTSTVPNASIWGATLTTFGYAAGAGLVATVAALPIGLLSVRYPGRRILLLERTSMLILAVPGIVVALTATYVTEHFLDGRWYQTTPLLILVYAIMFFPMAVVSVRAAVARAPVGLEEVGNSLGVSRRSVFFRVTLPLIGPGLAAAFCLVFLETATELVATLILIPTGVQTLATGFWAQQTNLSYGAAAPYAGLMVLIAAVPSYVLGRWFARLPARTAAAGAPLAPGAPTDVLPPVTIGR